VGEELPARIELAPSFGKVLCESTWKWDTREQPLSDYDLWYVWSGEGHMILNERKHLVGKGTCFLFRPGDRTYAVHDPLNPLTVTFVHFTLPRDLHASLPESHHVVKDTFLFETYLGQYVEAMVMESTDGEQEARLLLSLLLIQLRKEKKKTATAEPLSTVIRSIANRVRQNPGHAYTMETMAEFAQLSPRYFAIKFKQVMGCSVEHFLIRARIERAEYLLRYNGMNVTEVAEALGYKDLSFFSRQFKQFCGKRPSQVRKQGTAGI